MRSFSLVRALTLSIGSVGFLALGCSSGDFDGCKADNNCNGGAGGTSGDSGVGGSSGASGTGGTSGTSGTGGSGGDSGTCDTSKSPSEEACLVTDKYAIFVSPVGSDGGSGTKSAPVQSWEKALSLGKAAGKLVIACNDEFTTPVSLTSAHSGGKLYGGFKCSDWSYEAAKKTKLAPSAEGVALSLDGVVGFHAEDVIIEARDATTPGASSIAMFAKGSGGVTLRRVELRAGKGGDGAKGVVVPFTYPKQTDLNGNDASGTTGGKLKTWNCPGGMTTIGGKGGDGIMPSGQAGTVGGPDHGGGQPGQPGSCAGTGTGKDGATPPATPAAAGATALGTLTSAGWAPANGTDGATGSPGQGGGGGASTATAGGGGGGAGGCGGAGGPGGQGGGASIALLLLDTPIMLDASVTLTTKDAGKGGDGVVGQGGQVIFGFKGNGAGGACQGGNGAPGADGGAGGGAAGGVSVAVLWKGAAAMAPVVDTGTAVSLGAKGAKGIGGKAGSNDGIDGVAQDVVEVK